MQDIQSIQEIRQRTEALIDLTRAHAALRNSIRGALDLGITRAEIVEHLRGEAAEIADQEAAALVGDDDRPTEPIEDLWPTLPADLQDTVAETLAQS